MKRGEALEILEETTERLEEEAKVLKGGAQQVKKNILKWHRFAKSPIFTKLLDFGGSSSSAPF